jgi:hypothetical protein
VNGPVRPFHSTSLTTWPIVDSSFDPARAPVRLGGKGYTARAPHG